MKSTNAFFIAGMMSAALGAGAVFMFSGENKDTTGTEPTSVASTSTPEAMVPVYPEFTLDSELSNYTKYTSHSMYVDVLRATHIAMGTVVEAPRGARVEIVFQPIEYLYGQDLGVTQLKIKTETNAVMDYLVGQTVAIAFIEGERNGETVYGACHGPQSITPSHLGVDQSYDFYTDMIDIMERHEAGVRAAIEANPDDGRFPFPESFVNETKNLLLNTFTQTGTRAAHHAGRVLFNDPVYSDILTSSDLAKIADAVRASNPQTYDRGYGIMILNKHGADLLSLEDTLAIVRDEKAMINLDHLGLYISRHIPNGLAVPALAEIFMNSSGEETPQMIRNALETTWQVGDKLALPYFDRVLGTLTDRDSQRALLKGYRGMHDPRNLEPLVIYLNGGLPSEVNGSIAHFGDSKGVSFDTTRQSDCKDSKEIMKRTILAIAMIDSPESNQLIDQMTTMGREQWVRDFCELLREENKEWRAQHEILEEGDSSARAIK